MPTLDDIRFRLRMARHDLDVRATKAALTVARAMPRWLVYWCVIRAWSAATTGPYGTDEAPAVLAATVLDRWHRGARG